MSQTLLGSITNMNKNEEDFVGYLVLTIDTVLTINMLQNFQSHIRILFMKYATTHAWHTVPKSKCYIRNEHIQ